nr:PREDICTED: toll-like receptor 5 [Latimeria chalumnae]|eukprot:XP_005998682.1 PREDICTED: toll-like receptor 5 [Latimeria chalumnae]
MWYNLLLVIFGATLITSDSPCKVINQIVDCSFRKLTQVPFVPEDTTELILNFNYIQEVNSSSFPRLQRLKVLQIGTQFTKHLNVGKEAFENLPSLLILDLGDNGLLKLDPDAFVGLVNVKVLLLYHNRLDGSILESDYLRDMVSLEKLDLFGNVIRRLTPHSLFSNLSSFNFLNLKLNQISTLCETDLYSFRGKHFTLINLSSNRLYNLYHQCGNPFRNITLESLDLSSNGMTAEGMQKFFTATKGTKINHITIQSNIVGRSFGYFNLKDPDRQTFAGLSDSFVKILDVSKCFIFSLNPSVFYQLQYLDTLILSSNKINEIKRMAFNGLNNLQILNLSSNLLGEIYDYTFQGLDNIMHIDLQKNHIGAIQHRSFNGLEKLQILNLRDNSITTLHTIANIPSLRFVSFGENKLQSSYGLQDISQNISLINFLGNRFVNLDELFGVMQIPTMQYISFRNNRLSICVINAPNIPQINQLIFLDLSENMLQLIWGAGQCLDVFMNFSKLKELYLQDNLLAFLPKDVFRGLTSLQTLNLSYNSLSYIATDTFPRNVKILDLSRNHLVSPRAEAFNFVDALDLRENQFICDCALKNLILWLNETNTTFLSPKEDTYCVFPEDLFKVPLHLLSVEGCEEDDEATVKSLKLTLFVFTFAALLIFIAVVIIFTHFRGHFFIWYKKITLKVLGVPKEEKDNIGYKYDAYLCFCNKDFDWVQKAVLEQLDSQYKENNRYHLCFEDRDFIPGYDHITNIRDAIWSSKKTICIVTREFLKDGWCIEAFNLAQSRYFHDCKDVLIVVVVGRIPQYHLMKYKPIRAFMQSRPYLRWPEELQDVDWFLEKLAYLILKKKTVKRKTNNIRLQRIKTVT